MRRLLGRRGVAAAFVALAAIAVGGIAYASIPDSKGVIHGCYRKTTGRLIVIDSGKGCEEGWTPLNWSQTGPAGPPGALSSAYLDAYSSALQVVPLGHPISFNTVVIGSGIVAGATFFTAVKGGVYEVTVDLQGVQSALTVQLNVNGFGVGPYLYLDCVASTCSFTRIVSVATGGMIRVFNVGAGPASVDAGSGISIVRIA